MSVVLLDNIPFREVAWKGKTLNQITSSIQKNRLADSVINGDNIFRAMPLKIYRREIAANLPSKKSCSNSRYSSSIDEINRPGGSVITIPTANVNADGLALDSNGIVTDHHGLVNVIESPEPSCKNNTYGCGSGAKTSYNCAEDNARRRCRSSGIIKRTYDPARSEIAYFTNTNQYLVSRSKTFTQNQYRHVRQSDISIVTNPLSSVPTYSPNGISHCLKAQIVDGANQFSYKWIDGTTNVVTIAPGNYDVNELNSVLESVMFKNEHFLIYTPTQERTYLMKIIYNTLNSQIELQSFPLPSTNGITLNPMYVQSIYATWSPASSYLNIVPVFVIPATGIQNVIGFSAASYPDIVANAAANQRSTPIGFLSNLSHKIYPAYSIMYYKPNNKRFATQGGVSSGDMTTRIKYETISTNALKTGAALGSQVGSAMSYGVSEHVYTMKDKLGYPLTKTPVVDSNGSMKCYLNAKLKGRCSTVNNV